MTALCGGGASGPQAGLGQRVIIPVGLINAGLGLISPFLLPLAAFIDGFTYDLVASCSADPPACPTFDATDMQNMVNAVTTLDLGPTYQKVLDLIHRYFWFQYCQCTSAATPAFDCWPTQPQGTTVGPTSQPSGGCDSGTWQGNAPANSGGGNFTGPLDITTGVLPTNGQTSTVTTGFGNYTTYGIPAGATGIQINWQTAGSTTCPNQEVSRWDLWTSNDGTTHGGDLATSFARQGVFPNFSEFMVLPTTAKWWTLRASVSGSSCQATPAPLSLTLKVFCGGETPSGLNTPCTTDPVVLEMLQRIFQLENLIYTSLPTQLSSYSHGAVHSGLSGSGELPLGAGCLALLVDVTFIPPSAGVIGETPTYYPDLGWITPQIVGTPYQSQRITFQHQQFLLPSLTDSFNWTLYKGTIIDVTELTRGP